METEAIELELLVRRSCVMAIIKLFRPQSFMLKWRVWIIKSSGVKNINDYKLQEIRKPNCIYWVRGRLPQPLLWAELKLVKFLYSQTKYLSLYSARFMEYTLTSVYSQIYSPNSKATYFHCKNRWIIGCVGEVIFESWAFVLWRGLKSSRLHSVWVPLLSINLRM